MRWNAVTNAANIAIAAALMAATCTGCSRHSAEPPAATGNGSAARPESTLGAARAPEHVPPPGAEPADTIPEIHRAVADLVRLRVPSSGAAVTSPLVLEGEARGPFYFEAVFSVRLEDASGHSLARAIAHARGEWTTENWVPFEAVVAFPPGAAGVGVLVLEGANPSGLPGHARSLRVPVHLVAGNPG